MGRHDGTDPGIGRHFRIWVQGRLDDHFSDGLIGIEQEDVPAGSMLRGELVDEAQVHSTLDLLRSLGIVVLRFEVDPLGIAPNEQTERPSEGLDSHEREENS